MSARVIFGLACLVACALALAPLSTLPSQYPEAFARAMEAHIAKTASVQRVVDTFKAQNPNIDATTYPAVILVPGLGGSELEAKLDRQDGPAWLCSAKSDWYNLWINIQEILASSCLLGNLGINYFPNNNTYADVDGVLIRPVDWQGLGGVTCLDSADGSWFCSLTEYFAPVINALEGVGYQEGTNLFGAPYDWRLGTDYLYTTEWQQNFTALVELAYSSTGGQPVHLVTHSMGGPTALYFLNAASAAWKAKYIASFIPIAGPWSGSPQALKAVVSGDNFGVEVLGLSFLDRNKVADIARQSGGIVELIPNAEYYNETWDFIVTPSKSYDDEQFVELFTDMGLTAVTVPLYNKMAPLIDQMTPPAVPTYCLYGYGLETPYQYVYAEDWAPGKYQQPSQINADNFGDGTVPLESLQLCNHWDNVEPELTACREYDLSSHIDILSDDELLADLVTIVTKQSTFAMTCNTPVLDNYLATSPKFKPRAKKQ